MKPPGADPPSRSGARLLRAWPWVLCLPAAGCQLWLTPADLCGDDVQRVRWYLDADGDGFGDPSIPPRCDRADGYADNGDDCDDTDPTLGSAASIGERPGLTFWCRDDDRDGVGREDDCLLTCTPPEGYEAPTAGDCDDANPLFTVVCPWSDVSAERQATCGLRTDGTVACWGNDEAGLITDAPVRDGFVEVSTGRDLACARRENGTVVCWGLLSDDPPEGLVATAIATGWGSACALDEVGAVTCWGRYALFEDVLTQAPARDGFVSLVMDEGAGCVLDGEGRPTCWGDPEWDEMLSVVPGKRFQQVSLGRDAYDAYGCGVTDTSAIACWGLPSFDPPPGRNYVEVALGAGQGFAREDGEPLRAFGPRPWWSFGRIGEGAVRVTLGDTHACALLDNGQITCWGDGRARQTEVPAPGLGSIDAGGSATCGITAVGSDLRCWGESLSIPEVRFQVVDTATEQRCGLRESGRVDCWSRAGAPLAVGPTGAGYQDLFVGGYLSCVIDPTGALECWNLEGAPEAAPVGNDWRAVEVSIAYGCALGGDGEVQCFGSGPAVGAEPTGPGFVDVSVGGGHGCALDAGGFVTCWGYFVNAVNEPSEPWPHPVEGGFVQVSAGAQLDCALRADGTVTCWGDGGTRETPPWDDFTEVDAGGYGDACGLRAGGVVTCWGSTLLRDDAPKGGGWTRLRVDDSGLTNACAVSADGVLSCWGAFLERRAPTDDLAGLSLGDGHGCALWRDEVRCFGADGSGQADAPLDPFVAVAAGGAHTCALGTGGAVTCWGADDAGQSTVPAGLGRVESLVAGGASTCARLQDGALTCWGDLPAAPAGSWSAVGVGVGHACALSADGAVSCWGRDDQGQATVPAGLAPAVQLAVGGWHTCALGEDGYPTCWGLDSYGQARAPRVRFTSITAGAEHSCGVRLDGLPWCWGRDLEGQSTAPPQDELIGD